VIVKYFITITLAFLYLNNGCWKIDVVYVIITILKSFIERKEKTQMNFDTMIREAENVLFKSSGDKAVVTALLTDKDNLHINICTDFCQGAGEKFCGEYSDLKAMIAAGEVEYQRLSVFTKRGDNEELKYPAHGIVGLFMTWIIRMKIPRL
jgi:hypothetical protein